MTTLTIRLPEDLKALLDELSRSEDRAVSDIVRESIRRYIAIERFRSVRKKVLTFAESQGLLVLGEFGGARILSPRGLWDLVCKPPIGGGRG